MTTPPTDPATKPIFVYRNFIIALHFYSIQRASYSRPELFLRDSKGNVCLHSRNGSPFWNFSNPDARRFFLEEMVTQAAMESGVNRPLVSVFSHCTASLTPMALLQTPQSQLAGAGVARTQRTLAAIAFAPTAYCAA